MIEAFDEVLGDQRRRRGLPRLAAQTKANPGLEDHQGHRRRRLCAAAARARPLASDALVEVKLGGIDVTPGQERDSRAGARKRRRERPSATRAGHRVSTKSASRRRDIKPKLGEITVQQGGRGRRLGQRALAIPRGHEQGDPLRGHAAQAEEDTVHQDQHRHAARCSSRSRARWQVGDELVVRIELRVDRDMEYVHLKDQRGSGTEPVNVLSQYKYQDGLAYYESTRDTASHFFIDYLPKGTYVFEYSTRVQLRGEYQTGMAESSACTPPSSTATARACRSRQFGLTRDSQLPCAVSHTGLANMQRPCICSSSNGL